MSVIAILTPQIIAGKQYEYISIVDADTGQPANGNNIIVTYQQTIGGVTTNHSVTIAGQSVTIYVGNYNAGNSWTITGQSTGPDHEPPVNQCDLKISYITVDKPESAPSANDAQITVTATSSYLPITYSLDGITFQSSDVFTGLHSGVYTVYCADSNSLDCLANKQVNIPQTRNLLVSDPSVTLTNGNSSRWSAAFNPIVFTYQRKDFEVTKVVIDSLTGNAKVSINGDMSALATAVATNAAAQASAAKQGIISYSNIYVYVNAGPYVGTFIVTATTGNDIIIQTPYTANATGFMNSNTLRPYYKMLTNITYLDPLTNAFTTITSVNRPDNQGVTRADISNLLQSILRVKDDSTYAPLNFRDSNLSASYTIQYAEHYDDGTAQGFTSVYIPVAAPYYVTYTARQLQSQYAGNLMDYVPFPVNQQAKWITEFAEPAYTNSYPFDLSFIYGETLAGRQLYYKMTLLDINRQPIADDTLTAALLNEDGSWLLNQDSSRLIIASQNLTSTPITEYIGLNRLCINQAFDDEVYYFQIALFYNQTDSTPVQITKTQTVRVDHAPDINSVYMRWIGLTGSWNYYRFIYNQEISLDVQNATIIKNFVSDWQNQDGIEEVISKDAGQKIMLTAEDLSVADIRGLQSIKYSPKVQMLINTSPIKWQTVVLNTATFTEYETINGQAPFSITFNQPSINIQTQ